MNANRDLIEIRMHGLGGQGMVIAKELLSVAFSKAGYHVQSFSQYGAERRGGQVESYLRVSMDPISIHSKVYDADYIMLANDSLVADTNIMNVKQDGIILVNSPQLISIPSLDKRGIEIITLDADEIALKNKVQLPGGTVVVNTTLTGAFIALFPEINLDHLEEAMSERGIPGIEKNMHAARVAYQRVKDRSRAHSIDHSDKEKIAETQKTNLPEIRTWPAPCEVNCPIGMPIRKFVRLIENNKFSEALEEIMRENPFPGICGRVCFHPCETNCNRDKYDEAVAINALERAVFDYSDQIDSNILGQKPRPKERKIAIIGAGPAGLSCAYFLRLTGYDVTIFEASPVIGGIPRFGIPAYRLPEDIVDKEVDRIVDLGLNISTETKITKELFIEIFDSFDACFVATGAHSAVRLGIPGEETQGVTFGLDFLKHVALDDDFPITLGNDVVVVGGGNTAIDAARTAKRLGAKKVVIVYRRSEKEMPAYFEEAARAKKEAVQVEYFTIPVRVIVSAGSIKGLECMKTEFSGHGQDGRRQVRSIEGSNFVVKADNIIVAAGEATDTSFLPDSVERESSLVKVDLLGRTSVEGLYAGGDITTYQRTVSNAIGSGKRAAIGIDLFLSGKQEKSLGFFREGMEPYLSVSEYFSNKHPGMKEEATSFSDLNINYFKTSPRTRAKISSLSAAQTDFSEINLGISENAAIAESKRCFQCGVCTLCNNCYIYCPDIAIMPDNNTSSFTINPDFCKECGICVEECPRGVVRWKRN
jgi:2-oxoacid:acceptor oxidoreductase gamma subunit (pyruvate/2-ketoisovalerate family)